MPYYRESFDSIRGYSKNYLLYSSDEMLIYVDKFYSAQYKLDVKKLNLTHDSNCTVLKRNVVIDSNIKQIKLFQTNNMIL